MPVRRVKRTPQVPIDEPTPITGRIAWHIENTLVRFVKRIFNSLAEGIKNVISFAIEETLDVIEDGLLDMGKPIFDEVLKIDGVPSWIKGPIIEARKGEQVAAVALLIPIVAAGLMAIVMGVMAPVVRRIQYEVEQVIETYRPNPETIVQMMHRSEKNRDWAHSYVTELGVSADLEQTYIDLVANRVPDNVWGNAYLRKEISEPELRSELRKRSMPDADIDIFVKMLQIIPGPQDLIRMAVREAWNDNVANTFGYDKDWPPEFGEWAEKIGLSREWAKKFWRAHWELPGIREGFELLHRQIIDEGELGLLLQSRDIPEFWRERLTELSYRPFTRVDVRRMYASGVVNVDEVYKNYRDLGSDDSHAQKLTDWTIQEYGESSRDLTKGDVISAYTDNIINEGVTQAMLKDLGYIEEEINILLARADLKRQSKYEKELTETVRVAFVGRQIETQEVFARLSLLNPPSGFIEERLTIWELQRERNLARPTKADLKKLWVFGIISEAETRRELLGRNYTNEYADWYMELWKLEAAQKEQ